MLCQFSFHTILRFHHDVALTSISLKNPTTVICVLQVKISDLSYNDKRITYCLITHDLFLNRLYQITMAWHLCATEPRLMKRQQQHLNAVHAGQAWLHYWLCYSWYAGGIYIKAWGTKDTDFPASSKNFLHGSGQGTCILYRAQLARNQWHRTGRLSACQSDHKLENWIKIR